MNANTIYNTSRSSFLGAVALSLLLFIISAGHATAQNLASGSKVTMTEEEIRMDLSILAPDTVERYRNDPRQAEAFIKGLMVLKVFSDEAIKRGLADDPAVRLRAERARQQALSDALRDVVLRGIKEPDFEKLAQEEYKASISKYQIPGEVRVRHILLLAKEAGEVPKRHTELEAILARIKDGSLGFEDAARQYSEDPTTKPKGGDLGYFGRGRMVPQFEQAAFALKSPGEISGIVQTRFGVHLIQLVDRKETKTRPFDEVRATIISQVRADFLRDHMTAWEHETLESDTFKVDSERLQALLNKMVNEPARARTQ